MLLLHRKFLRPLSEMLTNKIVCDPLGTLGAALRRNANIGDISWWQAGLVYLASEYAHAIRVNLRATVSAPGCGYSGLISSDSLSIDDNGRTPADLQILDGKTGAKMSIVKCPIAGSCQCGQVTYQLLEPPLMVAACHCKECQKLSTSAFSITAVVETESVEFKGELKEWRRLADSGNKNYAKFCARCGNRIYHFDPDKPGIIRLKPSNLTDTTWLSPSVHMWVSEKQVWYQVPEGVQQYDKQPPI
jgi:hypothetical protein